MDDDTLHTIEEQSDGIPTVQESASTEYQTVSESSGTVSVSDSVADNPQSETLSPLQIAFSVYTATNGYDWSNIPEGSDHEGLDFYYQKAVERKPDFMSSGDVVKGVFACDGNIAVFRIQVVKHWDSFGRDADYCAFAFLTYDTAWRVDFEELLNMPEFTNPRHDPPTSMSYSGKASKNISSEESVSAIQRLYNGESLQSFDFAKIGALLSTHGNKSASWLFCKVECAIENSITVSTGAWTENPYPPPPPPPPVQSPEPVEEPPHESFITPQSIEPIETPIPAQVSMPSPQPANCAQQADSCTVAADARSRTQISAIVLQKTFRQPMADCVHRNCDNSCVMTPVSPEEMRVSEAAKHKASSWFGFDTLTVVLAGVCAILVAVLLWLVFYMFFPKGSTDIGISMGKEQPVLKIDESGIREITSSDAGEAEERFKKGGE